MATAMSHEHNGFREAEYAANQRRRCVERELAASTREAEVMSSQLRAISEEKVSANPHGRPCDGQSGAEAVSLIETRANQEVQQLQAVLRTERSASLASENQLGALAQTMQAGRNLQSKEQEAAAHVLRERAQLFEATVGAQAEIVVSHARSEAAAQVEKPTTIRTRRSQHGGLCPRSISHRSRRNGRRRAREAEPRRIQEGRGSPLLGV